MPPPLDEYVGEESMDDDVDDEEAMTLRTNIDNTTLVLAVSLEGSTKHFTMVTKVEHMQLRGLGDRFVDLVRNMGEIRMVINCQKTQLLVVSPANRCNTVTSFTTPDGPIHSVYSRGLQV